MCVSSAANKHLFSNFYARKNMWIKLENAMWFPIWTKQINCVIFMILEIKFKLNSNRIQSNWGYGFGLIINSCEIKWYKIMFK